MIDYFEKAGKVAKVGLPTRGVHSLKVIPQIDGTKSIEEVYADTREAVQRVL